LFGTLKKFILWSFDREQPQYLAFCLLIVAFIFLTPRSWFERRDVLATQTTRLVVQIPDFAPGSRDWERRVRELSGDPDAEVVAWRETRGPSGEKFYEIEIR
jgi:hypothetical protein